MRIRKPFNIVFSAAFLCLALQLPGAFGADGAADKRDYSRIVVISDTHLSESSATFKGKMIADVNAWPDVDLVAVPGDLCARLGAPEEYAYAGKFFAGLSKPAAFIGGNHDYIYSALIPAGKKNRAAPEERSAKLEMFRKTFNTPGDYYSRRLGGYLLVFLSVDSLSSGFLAEMSKPELEWLAAELAANRKMPTIIFYHAPLNGTLLDYHPNVNTPDFTAQPEKKIRKILKKNPQVFMWVSGHTHTSPAEPSYASPVNLYEGRVTDIQNASMDQGFTNSLYLYPDKVLVRTYDHAKGIWLEKLERTVTPPAYK